MSEQNDDIKTRAKGKAGAQSTTALSLKEDQRREVILARIEEIRATQRAEGSFDCFGTATDNYCDQGGCLHYAECMSVSTLVALPFP